MARPHLHRPCRPAPGRRGASLLALVLVAAVAAGCASDADRRLIVADAQVGAEGTTLWAVEPGEDPGDDAVVARQVTRPNGIRTLTDDGTLWTNTLGRGWKDRVLLSYGGAEGSRLTAGSPGEEADAVARSDGRLDTVVLRRGLFVATDEGCSLASGPEATEEVGRGGCAISEDERWVVSWTEGRGGFAIRDLRSGEQRRVRGGEVVSASPLGRDARVLAAQEDGDGVLVRVVDSTSGDTVAEVGRFEAVQVAPAVAGATGFVALVQRDGGRVLLHVDTDGRTTTLGRGPGVVPVTYGATVVFLELGEQPGTDRLWRWTPGDDEPEELLSGRIGAAAIDPEHVVAMKELDGRVEIYREGHEGLTRSVVLRTDTSQPVSVERTLVHGDEVLLQVAGVAGTSLVVVDTHGEGRVPVRNWPYLGISSIDHDGSVLLTGSRRRSQAAPGQDQLLVVDAGADHAEVRARVERAGSALLHEGVIYATVYAGDRPEVRSLRARGRPDPKVLMTNKQLVGATWPEQGGATESVMLTRALLSGGAAPRA